MAKHENVTVDILIDGKEQPIFEDPNPEDNNKEKGNNFFVEAINDARFTVMVTLSPQFKLFDAHGVLVYLDIDGRHKRTKHAQFIDNILFRTGSQRSVTFTTLPYYDATARQWQNEAFSFGKLRLLESSDREDVPDTLQSLGQISVEVKRVTQHLRSKPAHCTPQTKKAVTQVSEKLLKGKAIENAMKPITTGSTEAPVRYHDYHALAGSKGIPIKLNILYRSIKALQSLGCIPRIPSPEPDQVTAEEVRALRAEVDLLKQRLGIKSETPSSVVDLTSAVANGRAQVKRERKDDADSQHRKRSRVSDIEVVDLTDD